MISDAGNNVSATGYDSNSSSNPCHSNKRLRHDDSSSSVRFKGVVLQQNGHWGAQIYANHQRIWLGTFKSEKEAAMAYDSAAIKFRSGDSHRNFPWTSITIQEPNFQDLHTTESVLNMIKDGSYQSKFSNFVRTRSLRMESESEFNLTKGCVNERGFLCEQLFQKELTPSDVGKLNRLVIPKKHAIKYFPQVSEVNSEKDEEGGGVDDIQLAFFDKWMKSWKFRYCYWKSSQSFVFTRGWNRFVKEKELKAKDVITFYRCGERDVYKEKQTFCMIDIGYTHGEVEGRAVRGFDRYVDMKMELQLGMGENFVCGSSNREERCEEEEKVVMEVAPQPPAELETKSVRLFGVQISS